MTPHTPLLPLLIRFSVSNWLKVLVDFKTASPPPESHFYLVRDKN